MTMKLQTQDSKAQLREIELKVKKIKNKINTLHFNKKVW